MCLYANGWRIANNQEWERCSREEGVAFDVSKGAVVGFLGILLIFALPIVINNYLFKLDHWDLIYYLEHGGKVKQFYK